MNLKYSPQTFTCRSLCYSCIEKDPEHQNGTRRVLYRKADLKGGKLKPFEPSLDAPRLFNNRNRFFPNGGDESREVNGWGFWDLKTEPNKKNPAYDFPTVALCEDLKPIRVESLPTGVDSLIELLKNAVFRKSINACGGLPTLFMYAVGAKAEGWLINPDQILLQGNEYVFREALSIPRYQVNSGNVIQARKNHGKPEIFWAEADLTPPCALKIGMSPTCEPTEALARLIDDHFCSWSQFQAMGMQKSARSALEALLKIIEKPDLHSLMLEQTGISEDDYQKAKNELIEHGTNVVNGEDLTSEIVFHAMCRRPELIGAVKKNIRSEWESEHQSEIRKANEELTGMQKAISQLLQDRQKEEKNYRIALKNCRDAEERAKRLASTEKEASARFAEKLETARRDAAELISEFPFTAAIEASFKDSGFSSSSVVQGHAPASASPLLCPLTSDTAAPSVLNELSDALNLLRHNLVAAGVEKPLSQDLGGLLFTAMLLRLPLIFAGPQSSSLALALSLAVTGRPALTADLEEHSPEALLREIERETADLNNDEIFLPVIVLKGTLGGSRLTRLVTDLRLRRVLPIFTFAFTEELELFAPSLLNYALPLCTEAVMTYSAFTKRNMQQSSMSGDLVERLRASLNVNSVNEELELPEGYRLLPYAERSYEVLAGHAEALFPDLRVQSALMLCLLPALAVLGENRAALPEIKWDDFEKGPSQSAVAALEKFFLRFKSAVE
ncbi:hypothetical protein [uncultured Sutterella sp.]|uniref:hypothetical protein n=1 Tax=uncultured Sutterella sp. TaxID=286133 RepID=UPI002633E7AA|nr:hypothetical protein [uncultured Sutterella sp.]